MSTYYNQETGKYENFEHHVVTQLRRIHTVIGGASQGTDDTDDTEEEETDG